MDKPMHKSKTVWFNVITLVLTVLALPEFVRLLPESALQYIALANGLGNLALRIFFTNSSPTE